ncbi:MAG: helix-turn-helix transcriptional regulator [Bacteroidales bacterium]|jgi:transcriptional regulator with XRE-family HTH domain|nr:helix-turn-helix transcriptional regulator [Bacteroidales bacterium]
MNKVLDYLQSHQSPTPSRWREEAEWRRANWGWLRYSQYIAIRMMSRMDEMHMTQTALAEKMNCSQQYISKILKGQENLSLESIWKIESVLEINLVKSALTFVSGYDGTATSRAQYLNDSGSETLDPAVNTSDLVDGYKRGK